ncbi:protein unc-93 homolog A-like isoform X1 [Mya arenaria]|uniref:protein unc-93 homolog A-like isoform X1 n=1 Tax=Mya arenaria TaxID=6604 RepID=UPI0022E8AEF6|nr:protein unc-93 homolog A-like isoform X1 [Mya arenaria]
MADLWDTDKAMSSEVPVPENILEENANLTATQLVLEMKSEPHPWSEQTNQGSTSDAESYSSETPLLEKAEQTYTVAHEQNVEETTPNPTFDTCTVNAPDQTSYSVDAALLDFTGSALTLNFTDVTDIVQMAGIQPPQIYGSGWEFGSMCSINLHSVQDDGVRSSCNTLTKHDDIQGLQDRLLSRIFAEKISKSEFGSGLTGKELNVQSLEKLQPIIEYVAPQKTRNMRNVIMVCLSNMFLYSAVFGLRNLQSSINTEAGVGVLSLAVFFSTYMIGSFVSPFIVRRFPPRTCLCWSACGHIFNIVANYYPKVYTLVPSAALQGITSAVFLNAISTYITEVGLFEATMKKKSLETYISRYFGILSLSYQFATVVGNLVSSVIFMSAVTRTELHQQFYNENPNNASILVNIYQDGNTTYTTNNTDAVVAVPATCGGQSCSMESDVTGDSVFDDLDKLFLIGTYTSCGIISIVVIYCMLDKVPDFNPKKITCRDLGKGCVGIFKILIDRKFGLAVPLCLYTVLSSGFVVADILKSFITCPLGVQMVGYSMICYGVCGSLSSVAVAKFTRLTGRMPIVLLAAALNLGCLIGMMYWEPTELEKPWLLAMLGVWGFADGIWQSQTNSLISAVFADRYEEAFGSCRILQGVAGIAVFLMSNLLCMISKILFIVGACVVTTTCYIALEIAAKKNTKPAISVKQVEVN